MTTITTVGYGDISANNNFEMIYCSFLMLVGVISFSFANGALASIISNSDAANAKFQEKEILLNKIRQQHQLPHELYIQVKKTIHFEH